MSARLVVRAVIQILVAEQATPSLIAEAVPGLLAGPMETSWIPLALVTKAPFPAAVAPANKTAFHTKGVIRGPVSPNARRQGAEMMWKQCMNVNVLRFLTVTPYSLLGGYQRFEGTCYLHLQGHKVIKT